MKKIRIERQKGYYGMIRALEIIVDGVSVGKINQGQTFTFDAPDSGREIWGKMDWGQTDRLDISSYNLSQNVVFRGRFTLNFFRSLGIANMPFDVFLREDGENQSNAGQVSGGNGG